MNLAQLLGGQQQGLQSQNARMQVPNGWIGPQQNLQNATGGMQGQMLGNQYGPPSSSSHAQLMNLYRQNNPQPPVQAPQIMNTPTSMFGGQQGMQQSVQPAQPWTPGGPNDPRLAMGGQPQQQPPQQWQPGGPNDPRIAMGGQPQPSQPPQDQGPRYTTGQEVFQPGGKYYDPNGPYSPDYQNPTGPGTQIQPGGGGMPGQPGYNGPQQPWQPSRPGPRWGQPQPPQQAQPWQPSNPGQRWGQPQPMPQPMQRPTVNDVTAWQPGRG